MNLLRDSHKAGRVVEKNYTHYFVWDGSKENIVDGICNSPGIEVMVINPTTRYLYPHEFPSYEKFLNPSKFFHTHGLCRGSVIENNQLPLFHIYQTYPYYKRMFSAIKFDHYIMSLVGVSVLDYVYRWGIGIGLDNSQSKTVKNLSRLFEEINIAPPPVNVTINNEDLEHDYDSYLVSIEIQKVEEINNNYLNLGDAVSRYEIKKVIENKKHLPRFWRQSEIIDEKEFICDNQLLLF
jgi:hypothetical protein